MRPRRSPIVGLHPNNRGSYPLAGHGAAPHFACVVFALKMRKGTGKPTSRVYPFLLFQKSTCNKPGEPQLCLANGNILGVQVFTQLYHGVVALHIAAIRKRAANAVPRHLCVPAAQQIKRERAAI